MRKLRKLWAWQAGQSTVEFALTSLIIIPMLFAMIDVGVYFWVDTTLANAVREGAHYASVHGSQSSAPSGPGNDSAIISEVNRVVAGLPNPANLTLQVTWTPNNSPGSQVTVHASYQWHPFSTILWNGTLNIQEDSTMTIEH